MSQLPAVAVLDPKVKITGDVEGRINVIHGSAFSKVDLEDFIENGVKVEALGVEGGGGSGTVSSDIGLRLHKVF